MVYPAYLLTLLLMVPAFGLTALIATLLILSTGFKEGFGALFQILGYLGAGIAEPLRYGYRIVAFLVVSGFVLTAVAFPQLRTLSFWGLSTAGTLCAAFCLFAASREGTPETINALIVLSPSFVGIAAGVWFATKFQ